MAILFKRECPSPTQLYFFSVKHHHIMIYILLIILLIGQPSLHILCSFREGREFCQLCLVLYPQGLE